MTTSPDPPADPPGARNVVLEELPVPLSEQNPPEIPDPPEPEPEPEEPSGGATIAT